MEEIFFKSEIFTKLVHQSYEIMKYSNILKGKLFSANKKISEIEKLRISEIEELSQKEFEQKELLRKEINQLKLDLSVKETKVDLNKYFDISQITRPLIKTIELSEKNEEALTKEVINYLPYFSL